MPEMTCTAMFSKAKHREVVVPASHADLTNPSDFSIANVPQICSGDLQTMGIHHVDTDWK